MRASFVTEPRKQLSKGGMKRLRQSGRLPGVIMGLNQKSELIHISSQQFQRWLKGGGSGLLELQTSDAEKIPVLLEGLQRDRLTRDYIHVDFLRVKTDEKVRTRISLEFVSTPQGTKLGGIIQTQSTFIEVEALPHQLPSVINVDIGELNIGDSILAKDVILPSEVTLLTPEEDVLLSILAPRGAQEEPESE